MFKGLAVGYNTLYCVVICHPILYYYIILRSNILSPAVEEARHLEQPGGPDHPPQALRPGAAHRALGEDRHLSPRLRC